MISSDVVMLSILGGLLGLDTVSFPQAMLSRPLVAGTITGALLGHAGQGLVCGAVLELFAIDTLPFGASRYPEWGSSSVVGGGLFATIPSTMPGSLTTSVLAALAVAWFGGWSMVYVRVFNARLARRRHEAIAGGDRNAVVGLQLKGMTADLMRGIVLTAAGLVAFAPLQRLTLGAWGVTAPVSRAVVIAAAAAVSLGATYKLFHVVPGFLWQFLLGLATGVAVLVLR
jgi:mannose/fructose/N-acetylgalactosamine-specific phosphotransferase system component IIC